MASNLNPNAAPFVPMAYREVEDFSTEWWNLVKTSSWFRDFWLRECFREEKLEYMVPNDSELADLCDSFFPPSSVPQQKVERKMNKSSGKMDLMAWGADKWMETRSRPSDASRCFEKAPKIVSLRVSPRTIQQPR